MKEAILLGLLMGMAHGAQAASVVPNFTTGVVTSETTSRTEITENINITQYSNANSYTVSGTNINIPDVPYAGAQYTQIEPGAAFQFSETVMVPGISEVTQMTRTTTTDSFTTTTSVFTQ